MKSRDLLFLIIAIFGLSTRLKCQGFLKADGQRIVNGRGDNVLLRGIGLGGWMLQEGYMLHLNKEGQQYRIKQRIATLIGEEETKVFYNAWLSNHTTRSDIDSLHAWGSIQSAYRCITICSPCPSIRNRKREKIPG